MTNNKLAQFQDQSYLNLETYKRDGTPVATPMWFAEHDRILYVYSLANTGKVKRIRNNGMVRVVPSDIRGRPRGAWIEGRARILDESGASFGHRLLTEKYGLMKRFGDLFSRFRKRERVVIAIETA
jgi:PPOX class probable F420-dependent enzyme